MLKLISSLTHLSYGALQRLYEIGHLNKAFATLLRICLSKNVVVILWLF